MKIIREIRSKEVFRFSLKTLPKRGGWPRISNRSMLRVPNPQTRILKPSSLFTGKRLFALLTLVIFLITIVTWKKHVIPHPPSSVGNKIPEAKIVTDSSPPPGARATDLITVSRLLPVRKSTATHQWTEGDGLDPVFVEKIAHNPDEFIKMMEENERIKARQLVYRNDTAAAVIQRAKLTGEPLHSLTLPALDGREVQFEVVSADLAPSGQSGTFTGRLAGRPDSTVTLAFKFGREAFTILSPADNLYLQADPREPGEIILKSIDPATYAPARCGTPDIAAQ
jgi:hypothetical protein